MAHSYLLRFVAVVSLLLTANLAHGEPWLVPGDTALRHDLELLADAGILHSPVTTWPMSWPDIARDVQAAAAEVPADEALAAALLRVQRRAQDEADDGGRLEWSVAGTTDEPRLRGFGSEAREQAEGGAAISWMTARFAARVQLTLASDPLDGQTVRGDGSYAGINLGNFMISFGAVERWWGPGWDGSLILGTQARPMPGVTIERNYSDPFATRWLRWLGPWRASIAVAQAEGGTLTPQGQPSLPDAKFLAARVAFKPRPWLEVGLSRTAQFCGRGRTCTLGTVRDLLLGRDNRSASLSPSREPGNQMAGYDFRVRSPWRRLPVTGYAQFIGEDEANGLPSKFLGLLGVETWGATRFGGYRLRAEYADTTCTFTRQDPQFDCAYRSGIFPQGYAYRGRIIGHPLDNDGRMIVLAALLVRPGGDSLQLVLRRASLNRGGQQPDLLHALSTGPARLRSVELDYRRELRFGSRESGQLAIGVEASTDSGPVRDASHFRGHLEWRKEF